MPCNVRAIVVNIRIESTNVSKIDLGLLKQVAEEIALAGKGRVTATATGPNGEQIGSDCGIAIHTLDAPGGIALQIKDGRLQFQGDLTQPGYAKIKAELPNAYVDRVIESSLRGLHMLLTKKPMNGGIEYAATDLAGRQLKVLRQKDGKVRFDYGDGYDDAAYHETSDALKKAFANLGVLTEVFWTQKEDPEKWLTQEIAVIGKMN